MPSNPLFSSTSTSKSYAYSLSPACNDCVDNIYNVSNWFVGDCGRKRAEKLLRPCRDGTFLIRFSITRSHRGHFSLSMVEGDHIYHFAIFKSDRGFGLEKDVTFASLTSLVRYYTVHAIKKGWLDFNAKLGLPIYYTEPN